MKPEIVKITPKANENSHGNSCVAIIINGYAHKTLLNGFITFLSLN